MENGQQTIKVNFYQRKPRSTRNFSIETYFNGVRAALPGYIHGDVRVSKFESSGLFKRLYNCIEAILRQGDVNHITGDVHFLTIFLKKRKNVLTVLDCGQLKLLKGIKLKAFRYFWFTLPASRSHFITAISTATKEDLLRYIHFDPEKIKVVPVCISPAFKRMDKAFNPVKPRILQIGTAPNKNIERLINALAGICCELVVLGVLSPELKQLAEDKQIELVLFEKAIPEEEVLEQYRLADIVTLISTLEGFGMPIVEANTVGRVVITGNITSMPEIANDAAHIVDPFSVESMRNGFLKIINDSDHRKGLVEKGYMNCKRFSSEHIALQFAEIYKDIVQNKLN